MLQSSLILVWAFVGLGDTLRIQTQIRVQIRVLNLVPGKMTLTFSYLLQSCILTFWRKQYFFSAGLERPDVQLEMSDVQSEKSGVQWSGDS